MACEVMDVSIIILNWNTKGLLLECLESVYRSISGLGFEVIVVDNGSTDGSQEAVRKNFAKAVLVENKRNIGFAAAMNRAIEAARGRYMMLLNSDTVLTDGSTATLAEFMDEHEGVAISGPQLLNEDNSLQNSVANKPTLAIELLNKSLLRRLAPGRYPGKEHAPAEPLEVESIIGACMMVRSKAVADIGPLDEGFFFFLEETDWCERMRQRGWKVFHVPESRVYHLKGASAAKVNVRARIEYWISRYRFFAKHYAPPVRAALKIGLVLRLSAALVAGAAINLATLFLIKRQRQRLWLSATLFAWHLAGCPSQWGLRGAASSVKESKRQEAAWKAEAMSDEDALSVIGSLKDRGRLVRSILGRREVWRVDADGSGPCYVKLVFGKGRGVKRFFCGLGARGLAREAKATSELSALGVAVPEVLYYSYSLPLASVREVLITKEVKGALTLDEYMRDVFPGLGISEKYSVVRAFARFVRSLNDKGVVHSDPHMGNILVSRSEDGCSFHLLDTAETEISGPLDTGRRVKALALIGINFIEVPARLRYCFLEEYSKGLAEGDELSRFAGRLEQEVSITAFKAWCKKQKRCLGTNRRFVSRELGGTEIHIKRQWSDAFGMQGLLTDPDACLDREKAAVMKDGNTVKAAIAELGDGTRLFVKRYNRKGLLHTLKNVPRTSRAKRVFELLYGAELRGLQTPRPVALIEERRLRVLRRSYVITEFIEDAVQLAHFPGGAFSGLDKERRERLMAAVGRVIGTMHARGFYHGDLKWNNILVKASGDGGPVVYIIDFDGSRLKAVLDTSECLRDLERFMRDIDGSKTSAEERDGFLYGYLGANRSTALSRILGERVRGIGSDDEAN